VDAVPERFSPEWIAALDEAARALPGGDQAFVVQQVVTGGDGERAWHVDLGDDGIRVRPGKADDADVTFTQDRATAEAIATGRLSTAEALTSGRLTVRGATARLTEHREAMARLDEALAAVGTDA
jgi:alkyl sulfatase BDS1-like metallo-beta-lactamase superfamily hydrolase